MLKVATLPSHDFAVFWIRTSESAWATSAAVLLSCNLGWRWVPFIGSSRVHAISFYQPWRLKFYSIHRWFQTSITTHERFKFTEWTSMGHHVPPSFYQCSSLFFNISPVQCLIITRDILIFILPLRRRRWSMPSGSQTKSPAAVSWPLLPKDLSATSHDFW